MDFLIRLFPYLKKYKKDLAIVLLFHLLTAVFTVVSIPMLIPFFQILFDQKGLAKNLDGSSIIIQIKNFFASIIEQNDKQTALLYMCVFILIIFLLKNIFRYLAMYFMTPIRNGIIKDLRTKLYNKFLSFPVSYFQEEKKGNLLSLLSNDVVEIEWSILNTLVAIFKAPLIIMGSIAFMIYISPSLSLFIIILLLFTIVIVGGLSRKLKASSAIAQSGVAKLMNNLEETIYGIKAVKAYGAGEYLKRRFEMDNDHYKNTIDEVLRRRDLSSPLSEILGITIITGLLWVGSNQVFDQELSAAVFFALVFAFYQVIEPAKTLSAAYFNIQKGMAALDRIDNVLDCDIVEVERSDAILKSDFKHNIEFKNVHFNYADNEGFSLVDLNFEISKGEKVAIIGASGSGKTTIAELLMRYHEIDSGQILIDGIDIKECGKAAIRSIFGLVTQHPILFHETITNNIALGQASPNLEKVKEASEAAFALEFIQQQALGFDTVIGNEGMKLSGGERQRICLARAIYHNAPILVLDEATSNLDSESEQKIKDALDILLKNKTAVIIAHRLSTIRTADKILVMENGKIVQRGTHIELLNDNTISTYKDMVEMQSA